MSDYYTIRNYYHKAFVEWLIEELSIAKGKTQDINKLYEKFMKGIQSYEKEAR